MKKYEYIEIRINDVQRLAWIMWKTNEYRVQYRSITPYSMTRLLRYAYHNSFSREVINNETIAYHIVRKIG